MSLKTLEISLWIISFLIFGGCVKVVIDTKPPIGTEIKIDPKRIVQVQEKKSHEKCQKQPIKIAVIDTGFGYGNWEHKAKLCKTGHKSFSTDGKFLTDLNTKDPVPEDRYSHGTNVVGIIDDILKTSGVSYCFIIIKFWDKKFTSNNAIDASALSFRHSIEVGADIINYSAGGYDPANSEEDAVKLALDSGIKVVASAGNGDYVGDEKIIYDIDKHPYYPAAYDKRIVVVGSLNKNGLKSSFSNYGKSVDRWEVGVDVTGENITMSGTSQATAVATGKIVSEMKEKCK